MNLFHVVSFLRDWYLRHCCDLAKLINLKCWLAQTWILPHALLSWSTFKPLNFHFLTEAWFLDLPTMAADAVVSFCREGYLHVHMFMSIAMSSSLDTQVPVTSLRPNYLCHNLQCNLCLSNLLHCSITTFHKLTRTCFLTSLLHCSVGA